MQDIEGLLNGDYQNKILWICDYWYEDYSQRPIRSLLPTRVEVGSFRGWTCFYRLDKAGDRLQVHPIYLYDPRRGSKPLHFFLTEEECRNHSKMQLKVAIKGLSDYQEAIGVEIQELQTNLDKL